MLQQNCWLELKGQLFFKWSSVEMSPTCSILPAVDNVLSDLNLKKLSFSLIGPTGHYLASLSGVETKVDFLFLFFLFFFLLLCFFLPLSLPPRSSFFLSSSNIECNNRNNRSRYSLTIRSTDWEEVYTHISPSLLLQANSDHFLFLKK